MWLHHDTNLSLLGRVECFDFRDYLGHFVLMNKWGHFYFPPKNEYVTQKILDATRMAAASPTAF